MYILRLLYYFNNIILHSEYINSYLGYFHKSFFIINILQSGSAVGFCGCRVRLLPGADTELSIFSPVFVLAGWIRGEIQELLFSLQSSPLSPYQLTRWWVLGGLQDVWYGFLWDAKWHPSYVKFPDRCWWQFGVMGHLGGFAMSHVLHRQLGIRTGKG